MTGGYIKAPDWLLEFLNEDIRRYQLDIGTEFEQSTFYHNVKGAEEALASIVNAAKPIIFRLRFAERDTGAVVLYATPIILETSPNVLVLDLGFLKMFVQLTAEGDTVDISFTAKS